MFDARQIDWVFSHRESALHKDEQRVALGYAQQVTIVKTGAIHAIHIHAETTLIPVAQRDTAEAEVSVTMIVEFHKMRRTGVATQQRTHRQSIGR